MINKYCPLEICHMYTHQTMGTHTQTQTQVDIRAKKPKKPKTLRQREGTHQCRTLTTVMNSELSMVLTGVAKTDKSREKAQ